MTSVTDKLGNTNVTNIERTQRPAWAGFHGQPEKTANFEIDEHKIAVRNQAPKIMKQTISFITLGVADLARSRDFYTTLGWQESSASQEGVAFFQAGSVAFALFQREALAEDAAVAPTGNGFPGFTLAHNVPSEAAVIATLDEAVAVGARLVRPAGKVFWGGFRGYFADPDGFLWEVCFNPFVPLDADGFVKLP